MEALVSSPRTEFVRSHQPDAGRLRGVSSGWMIVMSVGAHAVLATALTALAPASLDLVPTRAEVAVRLAAPPPAPPPPPAAIDTPPPPPEPAVRERPRPTEAAAPERPSAPEPVAEPAPTPTPTSAPPSVDDIFGDPPPAPSVMTSGSGSGGPAMASGTGGPGGRPGGTGHTLGAGGGPAPDDEVGDDAARRRARLAYKREIERLLRARTRYPRAALRDRLEGRVELALRIGADGSILGVRVAESSGYAMLDDAAVDSARMDRVPAPPAAAALGARDELVVGLVYVVR